jgi:hypothetical protein
VQIVQALTDAEVDPATAISLAKVLRPDKTEKDKLTWRDNVKGSDGKVYQVAYNEAGDEVKRVPQFVSKVDAPKGEATDYSNEPVSVSWTVNGKKSTVKMNPDELGDNLSVLQAQGVRDAMVTRVGSKGQKITKRVQIGYAPKTEKKSAIAQAIAELKSIPGSAPTAAGVARTGDPDLATAQAYIKKYGSKEKAMAAWQRGE